MIGCGGWQLIGRVVVLNRNTVLAHLLVSLWHVNATEGSQYYSVWLLSNVVSSVFHLR